MSPSDRRGLLERDGRRAAPAFVPRQIARSTRHDMPTQGFRSPSRSGTLLCPRMKILVATSAPARQRATAYGFLAAARVVRVFASPGGCGVMAAAPAPPVHSPACARTKWAVLRRQAVLVRTWVLAIGRAREDDQVVSSRVLMNGSSVRRLHAAPPAGQRPAGNPRGRNGFATSRHTHKRRTGLSCAALPAGAFSLAVSRQVHYPNRAAT